MNEEERGEGTGRRIKVDWRKLKVEKADERKGERVGGIGRDL